MSNEPALERYSRQMRFPGVGVEGQKRLAASRVTLCGCGALGTVLANALVRAGVGFLRVIDRDFIETHNLQRQVLFDESDVTANLPKAEAAARKLGVPVTVILDPAAKRDAFAASDVALAASGTAAVELAVTGTPAVIGYRARPLTAAIVRRLIKVKYASLVNLILDREATPELLQEDCRPDKLAEALDRLLTDPSARAAQRAAYGEALAKLAVEGRPSDRAAAVALAMIADRQAKAPPTG